MNIKIKELKLHNFKGTREASYKFDGLNARIEGRNGSGKSTVFDAFTWLLFGKDHKDQTENSFEPKTIDPATGKPFPRLEHWVEAVLDADGNEVTLRRCWNENWVKPTGEIEDVLKGHSTAFYINGQDAGTKKAYDQFVSQLMGEDAFKLITNPLYFIDDRYTDWKTRRRAILDLVKDDPGRAEVRKAFADIADAVSGRSIEDYRKRIALEKKANKNDMEVCLRNADGMREALPAEVDKDAVLAQIAALERKRDEETAGVDAEIAEVDKASADYNEANAGRQARVTAIWNEITKIQLEAGEQVALKQGAARDENNRRTAAALQAATELQELDYKLKAAEASVAREEENIATLVKQRGEAAADLSDLGERYQAEKAKAFTYTAATTCPTCGQEIPAATREEAEAKAREHFLAERKAAVAEIIRKAGQIKEGVKRLDETIAAAREAVAGRKSEIADGKAARALKESEVLKLKAAPLQDLDAIAEEINRPANKKIQELRLKASKEAGTDDTLQTLAARRRELEKKKEQAGAECTLRIRALRDQLSVSGERDRQLQLIAKKENEARTFADAIARCERLEARILAFIKADVDSVEKAIGSLFRVARWKMFDRTIDGGLVETCEVTSPDGVPFRSMNDAMKTLCGMDVIRVFSDRFGSRAPIFIDNAEGVLTTSFGTDAQVIRLVVKDCDITLVSE